MKIRYWLMRNQGKIAWFIIGWLTTSGIHDLIVGNYFSGIISLVFAFLNYVMAG